MNCVTKDDNEFEGLWMVWRMLIQLEGFYLSWKMSTCRRIIFRMIEYFEGYPHHSKAWSIERWSFEISTIFRASPRRMLFGTSLEVMTHHLPSIWSGDCSSVEISGGFSGDFNCFSGDLLHTLFKWVLCQTRLTSSPFQNINHFKLNQILITNQALQLYPNPNLPCFTHRQKPLLWFKTNS